MLDRCGCGFYMPAPGHRYECDKYEAYYRARIKDREISDAKSREVRELALAERVAKLEARVAELEGK